jgi:hypothetical protein
MPLHLCAEAEMLWSKLPSEQNLSEVGRLGKLGDQLEFQAANDILAYAAVEVLAANVSTSLSCLVISYLDAMKLHIGVELPS